MLPPKLNRHVPDRRSARTLDHVRVHDCMHAGILSCPPKTPLAARQAAATEATTISAAEPLDRAAQMMCERAAAHLVVLDPPGGYPVGILTTLDVASASGGPVE